LVLRRFRAPLVETPAASAARVRLQVSANASTKASSLALVQLRFDCLRSLGLAPPTIVSSAFFLFDAPRFATRILHKQIGPRQLVLPGPTRTLRLCRDVPKQRHAVKTFFTNLVFSLMSIYPKRRGILTEIDAVPLPSGRALR